VLLAVAETAIDDADANGSTGPVGLSCFTDESGFLSATAEP
jgi:hypothetical protein